MQIIRTQLSWNEAEPLLYGPLCDTSNATCMKLIRGAFSRGVQVSVVEFAYQVTSLMNQIALDYTGQRAHILKAVSELMLAYEGYLRPQLLRIQLRSLEILSKQM